MRVEVKGSQRVVRHKLSFWKFLDILAAGILLSLNESLGVSQEKHKPFQNDYDFMW